MPQEAANVVRWSKVGPGAYISSRGEFRLVASELLQATGRPDTLVNRLKVCEAAKRMIAEHTAAPVIITTDPPPLEVEVA